MLTFYSRVSGSHCTFTGIRAMDDSIQALKAEMSKLMSGKFVKNLS